MPTLGEIRVRISVDTTEMERGLLRAEYLLTRSWWRRTVLRIALWRLA